MPIYEYQCAACQERLEVQQKVDDPAPECPNSNCPNKGTTGAGMTRLISLSSFQLKGRGWYKTDYSKKG